MGRTGLYDMAGNVKEWVWNATGDERFILGGSWNEPTYMFGYPDARPAFDRSSENGFRCYWPLTAPACLPRSAVPR